MTTERLVELFLEKAPLSICPPEKVREDIAFLLSSGLTGEQIFFSINYLSRHSPSSIKKGPSGIAWQWGDIEGHYHIAKAKQARKALKESEAEYDSENKYQGKNTPLWFGKGIDLDLFK